MIKIFGNPKQEKAKKPRKAKAELKASAHHAEDKAPKKSEEQKSAPRELFWDGYSDIGYC